MSSTRWLPKNPLQPVAWASVILFVVDSLVLIVLHRFDFLTVVRAFSSLVFLWLYRRRSPFAWHVVLTASILIPICFAVGELFELIPIPSTPSGRLAIFYPYVATVVFLTYVWLIRDRWFRFIRTDI